MLQKIYATKILRKAQIAIEFIILIAMAFAVIFTFLIITHLLSEENSEKNSYDSVKDYGASLQEEFFLASEVQDGYVRTFNVPETINGDEYTMLVNDTTNDLIIIYESYEMYYALPEVNGTLHAGKNLLRKIGGVLYLN